MNFKVHKPLLCLGLSIALFSCSSDDDGGAPPAPSVSKEAVITNYATIAYQSYNDSYNSAINLKSILDDFIYLVVQYPFLQHLGRKLP